jgi:propionyl-CoA carboxylase beta chain
MASKHIRTDVNLAWPTAEIAVMGSEGAVGIIHRRKIVEAEDAEVERLRLVDEYRRRFANPYVAAERGYVDEVIMPRDTRRKLIVNLEMLAGKREVLPPKKHGNIPL